MSHIHERTVVGVIGDRGLPADERPLAATAVALEVLKPRGGLRHGDGTAGCGEVGRNHHRTVAATNRLQQNRRRGTALQAGEIECGGRHRLGDGVRTLYYTDEIGAGISVPRNGGRVLRDVRHRDG